MAKARTTVDMKGWYGEDYHVIIYDFPSGREGGGDLKIIRQRDGSQVECEWEFDLTGFSVEIDDVGLAKLRLMGLPERAVGGSSIDAVGAPFFSAIENAVESSVYDGVFSREAECLERVSSGHRCAPEEVMIVRYAMESRVREMGTKVLHRLRKSECDTELVDFFEKALFWVVHGERKGVVPPWGIEVIGDDEV